MFFSVSNDRIEWSFDFGHDSVTLTVKDFGQEMTISPKEFLRQLGARCCRTGKAFSTTMRREFQLPLTNKEHTK